MNLCNDKIIVKRAYNEQIMRINTEMQTFCIDSDMSSDKPLSMIDFIRLSFEEQREYIYKYNFRDNEEKIDFF